MKSKDIRQAFLDFFQQRGHIQYPSAPLCPQDSDGSLLFVNAGMVPFKDVFVGKQLPPATHIVSAQKCARAGGKHNDLDQVGYTARHHTFFEMLGNFTFFEAVKEQAIKDAWDFVYGVLKLSPKRLYITHYHTDQETRTLWKKITGLPDDHLISIATDDNFWSMGSTGPCGPCTEIFYDHGPGVTGEKPGTPEAEGDRFVEIWNLVFMAYDRQENGDLVPLSQPCLDTGMGLERVTAVMQNVTDNYQTDLFQPFMTCLASHTKASFQPAHKVIADHVRAASMLIAEGVLPSNEGRGYIVRRLVRRAIRHSHELGIHKTHLHTLFPAVLDTLGDVYPELHQASSIITTQLQQEEERFRVTLERGLKLLETLFSQHHSDKKIPGSAIFQLYDTYGFPPDVTENIAHARGFVCDVKAFEVCMKQQKEQGAWEGSHKAHSSVTIDLPDTVFVGDTTLNSEAELQGLFNEEGLHQTLTGPQKVSLIVPHTPFYAESGGQLGDTGIVSLMSAKSVDIPVLDTQKQQNVVLHHVFLPESITLRIGDAVRLRVDAERRQALMRHHSATHLLNSALRKVLGAHVFQKGSRVEPERLRFDFSHSHPLTEEQWREIEQEVNHNILSNQITHIQHMSRDEALQKGALALLGETYCDEVRVVSMGSASCELCGGTHVQRTGDIGLFMIQSESGVGAGIRRIEAVAGPALLSAVRTLKSANDKLVQDNLDLLKRVKKLESKTSNSSVTWTHTGDVPTHQADTKIHWVGGQGVSSSLLRQYVEHYRQTSPDQICAAFSYEQGKLSYIMGMDAALTKKGFSAVEGVRHFSRVMGGEPRGGGRSDWAQGGLVLSESKAADWWNYIAEALKF